MFTQIGSIVILASYLSLGNMLPTFFPNWYIEVDLILMAPYFSIVEEICSSLWMDI